MIHLVRDPFALAVSSYRYNRRGDEDWVRSAEDPIVRFMQGAHHSRWGPRLRLIGEAAPEDYATYLKRLPEEEGLLAETC